MKIIAVLGLSGVGKTTLVKGISEQKNVLHLTASDLIKARLDHTSEQLRQGTVVDNQELMLAEFTARATSSSRDIVVFDGHSIIDTPDGLLEIPLSVFQTIKPSAIVFLEAAPDLIAERRASDTGRMRPNRTVLELSQHQELAKTRAAFFANSLKVPFLAMASDDAVGLQAVLDEL